MHNSEEFVGKNLRILVIDDNRAVHDDFRKILCHPAASESSLAEAEAVLFDTPVAAAKRPEFSIDSAYQGQEGLEMTRKAAAAGRPYAMAFVDVRMPPGWDGIETVARIWKECPDLQIVICTAYSDYSWEEMMETLGASDQLVILKKPFDSVEVLQLASALTEKWRLQQEARSKMDQLERLVSERTRTLQETNATLEVEIIERKKVAEALREKARLLELARDAIFVRDLEGRIQFWNHGAELLYGWTGAEVLDKPLGELFPKDGPAAFALPEQVVLEKDEWNGELRHHTKSGQEVIVNSRWTLLRDAAGKARSVLVINTDVTEKKRLEAQFLRAQRMEGIGTLATGMAHDLNNILAPILISAGTLRWDLAAEEREDAISHIEASVKRGAEIIRQVLTFGRGVAGDRAPVNPSELLTELSGIVTQTFPKNINISFNCQPDVPMVTGDRTQLHQVLLNLSINARDAMTKGGMLKMHVETVNVDAKLASQHPPARAGNYVRFEVSDTGCGIPSGDLERIFDPFFTTKELGKGTGLGLSTVLGIVRSHHGFVTVESVVKQGTTFRVYIPVGREGAKGTMTGNSPILTKAKGEAVLLVDDEADIAAVNRRILERHGYRVVVAGDGREALELIAKNGGPFELVITDLMMPGMNGPELIRALRQENPRVRVIASSGLESPQQSEELQSLGVKAFLSKPYTAEKLLVAMQEALRAN